ncbi:MAG TPA: alpha/beta hydrolase [Bryobacteraceae bacterium]|nr:alpha/beta hydrolase [Bryobacteraceae bacterium]
MPRDILEIPPPPADKRISYGQLPLHFGDLRLPSGSGPHPLLIFIHGGFWRARYNLDYAGHLSAAVTAAGVATWNLEYRRAGDVGGGWPGTCEDVLRGVLHVRQLATTYPLDLNRIVVAGHSAGGHLALWVAAQHALPLRAAISLGGVADLQRAYDLGIGSHAVAEFLGGPPFPEVAPLDLLPFATPQVLIHGTADDVVPIEVAESFAQASSNARLVRLDGADHFDLVDPRSSFFPDVLRQMVEQ